MFYVGPAIDCVLCRSGDQLCVLCLVPRPTREYEGFDWQGDLPLKFPQRDLFIYEMHVRGFTCHESSQVKFPGTYLGVVEKLDHLKELGVNCIELMPCHEFNELEYYSYNSILGLRNFALIVGNVVPSNTTTADSDSFNSWWFYKGEYIVGAAKGERGHVLWIAGGTNIGICPFP
ncbi:unnamed protein product [Ilex paraguariensis]|uniref:Glycosyl hydrolase family 13 catalytic domain-containing protein n=1 Tax=Ilex paraguariensis TaxID=185542 RepID=A0ABC8R6G1_9AQUA